MATTKKTTPSKKLSVSKSTKAAKNAPRPWSWRFSVITVGIYAIVTATLIVAAFSVAHLITTQQISDRYDRIEGIYSSIGIDSSSYIVQNTNVFGDKRVYSYDKGRTSSSEIDYIHAGTVSDTVKDLDAKIKAAGFTFIDEPYPGSTSIQYHYKSSKGEYVRLSVSSKPYDDAGLNAAVMGKSAEITPDKFDTNAGPSNVILKVNLDDNNE